ncbi:MAG: hypothetical protein IPO59_13375 [Betaproteobacteria bacterium]|nr:hypothetical protein [Betaproteobacteria bacterium]
MATLAVQGGQIGRQRFGAALPTRAQRRSSAAAGRPASTGQAEARDHVDPGAAADLAVFFSARACSFAPLRRSALEGLRRRRCRRPAGWGAERNLVGEAVQVLPVDGQQQVEAVVQRGHRLRPQAQQRSGFRRRGSAGHWCAPSDRTGRRAPRRRAARCRRVATPAPPLPAMATEKVRATAARDATGGSATGLEEGSGTRASCVNGCRQ